MEDEDDFENENLNINDLVLKLGIYGKKKLLVLFVIDETLQSPRLYDQFLVFISVKNFSNAIQTFDTVYFIRVNHQNQFLLVCYQPSISSLRKIL